jgi:hypothetical protein
MRLFFALLWCSLGTAAELRAEHYFSAPNWAVEIKLEDKPASDTVDSPSPHGPTKASRYFLERAGENYLLVKFSYPVALVPGDETALFERSLKEMMKSRPGQMKSNTRFMLGPYSGYHLVIAQPRERTIREIRMIVIGSSLYICSAEYSAVSKSGGETRARTFFNSMALNREFEDPRVVEERERWRFLSHGNFSLRYDAARWYRDPADQELGVFNLLRVDERAEAQFIAEEHPIEGSSIEEAVLQSAREGADEVIVKRRSKKTRGSVVVSVLEFSAKVEKTIYQNHGYFYSGAEGTVQLRAWALDKDHRSVAADVEELLDGLRINSPAALR